MPDNVTESLHPAAWGLDARPADEILAVLLDGQRAAVAAVAEALPDIARGADMMAAAVRAGGRIVFAGAGSSALMANADGLELPGTFGVDPARIVLCMAGGMPAGAHLPGDTEDDAAEGAVAGEGFGAGDVVIAVTASGSTPYPMALAQSARARGARVVAIANNRGAEIFALADVAIWLPTPPEVIAGSTRMGAGTAQKVALNLMSTLMGVKIGAVHDGMMVALHADNLKLRARARAMVARIAGVDDVVASSALGLAAGRVKAAVLIALGAAPDEAAVALDAELGILRAAIARWREAGEGRREKSNQGSDR